MANKRVQISDDAGSNYYTFPGNAGEFRSELAQVGDTVFGQAYESNQPSLGQWNMTCNGIVKGIPGYNIVIKKSGTATTMTAEAMSLVSGKTYVITATARRIISYLDTVTVFDNAIDHTADVLSIDYLSGQVTFKAAYTPGGPITLTGKYLPMTVIAKARSFTLTQTQTAIDQTGYEDAQANGGWRVFIPGLKTATLEMGKIFDATSAWQATLAARGIVYVECDINAADPGKSLFRGFFKVGTRSQSGNQGDTEAETINLSLWVPDGALVLYPFNWYFTGTPINQAIQKALTSWLNQTTIKMRYLPTGVTGASPLDGAVGDAVPIECTITNAIDGQNEFSFNFRGTSTPAAV
jgi:hypothetical protein